MLVKVEISHEQVMKLVPPAEWMRMLAESDGRRIGQLRQLVIATAIEALIEKATHIKKN